MAERGMRQGLEWRTQQELRLEARMLQSTTILQLPAHELGAWLLEASAGNEALLVEPPSGAELEAPHVRRGASAREASARHDEMLQNHPDAGPSLAELLEEQLTWRSLGPLGERWARLVVRALDANGWLSSSDGELLALAEREGLEPDLGELARAISLVQGLEPRGVGGRGPLECLLLQLDPAESDYGLLCRLLEEFLDELAHNRGPRVARQLGIGVGELERLIARLGELDPRPAAGLGVPDPPPLVPDVVVGRDDAGEWTVSACGVALPDVRLDAQVERWARDPGQDRAVREHLARRVDQAQAIVEALRQRRETLLAVASAALRHQREYLERGPGHLRPLRMGAVADELGLHKSTVSRAAAGKCVQTPHGILPLRELFQAPAGEESNGARDGVREALRGLFAAEDPRHPLSDDEAVLALGRQGLRVARRTVAKYRVELGIQSSYRRRRHAG